MAVTEVTPFHLRTFLVSCDDCGTEAYITIPRPPINVPNHLKRWSEDWRYNVYNDQTDVVEYCPKCTKERRKG